MIGELKTDECVIIGPTLVCFNFSFVRVKKAVAEHNPSPPFVMGFGYLLAADLLFLSTTVSVITAPPLMKRSAIQRNIWLLSPVAGEFAFAWTLKVPSVLPSV